MNSELLKTLISQYKKEGYETMYFQLIGMDVYSEFKLNLYTGIKCDCITYLNKRGTIKEVEFIPIDKISRFSFEINSE